EELGIIENQRTKGLFTQPQETINRLQAAGFDPASAKGSTLMMLLNEGFSESYLLGLGESAGTPVIRIGGEEVALPGFTSSSD
ncbi:hypothetical protein DF186_21790, partial [Enterococcus hirae]